MKELLNQPGKITGVFAANDYMALGAIRAIKEQNLRISQDIAVVGFDDADFSSDIEPLLTTVKKPRNRMGRLAADMMIKLLNGEKDIRF